ncbi:MAG: endonuclease NucS [Marinosulfonomonas sp.]|nr:endonuclease NucS [Marinosulfonomonas sp.]
MRQDYPQWLADLKYAEGTQTAQIHRVKKVEEYYGNLEEHFQKNSYQDVINSLQYSTSDERENKPNPSKIQFNGNIRNNLQSYKSAAVRYRKFLSGSDFREIRAEPQESLSDDNISDGYIDQKFSLERDMQAILRQNIKNLDPDLTIIDDGAERSVPSGFIDITCEDNDSIIVIELKAGKADSRAIGQILGYMGDLREEEGCHVRGILVAHDFDTRTKAAARFVSELELKKYSIEFKFTSEE